jgi:hypothetical protein
MKRRSFLKQVAFGTVGISALPKTLFGNGEENSPASQGSGASSVATKDWLSGWQKQILADAARNRYCDHEMGEEIGWLVSPFLNGFYYGYLATHDPQWVTHFADWADSWTKRGVKGPDGFVGWPKSAGGGVTEKAFLTESLLGEAMGLRPMVLMADEILKQQGLQTFKQRAHQWIKLAGEVFEKWDSLGCWREVEKGGVWVVPDFAIDAATNKWTEGYSRRATTGFTNPDNKQNHIARWMLAMHDVTGKSVYGDRAKKWFRVMKSRIKTRENGKYFVWNYWDPAGPWDYNANGTTRHWVGVHPNGGYYAIDLEGIVSAFEHGLVFSQEDIQKLIATNRDFMWNHEMNGAKFQRIDGGTPDDRWKDSPGVLWTALVPHDETLRKIFLANHDPAGWGGLSVTPWYLSRRIS